MVTRCKCCIIFILPAYTHSSIPVWVTGRIIPNYTMHVNTKLGKSPCEKLDNNQADNFALYVNINYVDHRYLTQIVFNLLHTCYDQTACQLGKLLQNRLYWHDIVLTSLDTRHGLSHCHPWQLALFHRVSNVAMSLCLSSVSLSFESQRTQHSSEPNYNPLTDAVSSSYHHST